MIQQGQIVYIPFPFSNLSTSKPRPALIISNRIVNNTNDAIMVAISTHDDAPFQSIKLTADNFISGDLPQECFIHCHRIHLLEKSFIIKTVAEVAPSITLQVLKKVAQYLTMKPHSL